MAVAPLVALLAQGVAPDPLPEHDIGLGPHTVTGRVVTPVPAEGFGEITVRHGGQLLKLNASSDSGPIARSTTVVILEVTSPSSVVVADDAALWL